MTPMSDLTKRVRAELANSYLRSDMTIAVQVVEDALLMRADLLALCDEADTLTIENAALRARIEELSRMVNTGLEVSSSRVKEDTP